MSYSYTITAVPASTDPTQAIIQATLTDDSGAPDITRNYSLPVSDNPQAADFGELVQADVDSLNAAQTAQANLATAITSQTVVPVDNTAVQDSVASS